MSTHAMFWAIVLLGFVALLTMQLPDSGNRLRDFNFGTGLVDRVDKEHMWSPVDTGRKP